MARLHVDATISPTKLELLDRWVPTRPWFDGTPGAGLEQVAAYRFDDPAGEVGVETFLLRAGDGPVLQVPVTYRDAPLEGAEASLITTMEHSVLGRRWVYDGAGDPVWAATLTTAVLTGGVQADQVVGPDDDQQVREPSATVSGSGTAGTAVPDVGVLASEDTATTTVVTTGALEITLSRVLGDRPVADGSPVLVGSFGDREGVLLAVVREL
ncbi:CG0192-related protein [Solicola sp. PLA-1-18]|uniref:CG0192-related protein n=1 Tax=Solicola sp. PLA-1-18 TaxID=3380532 RepID=UPI003B77F189